MRAALLALALLAGPAAAQSPGGDTAREVEADLDGDGRAERYRLVDGVEPGVVDLSVDLATGPRSIPGIAWSGGMAGQEPGLGLSPAGSLRLTSMNDSMGRDRWRLTLTIAHRDGDWRVAGVTYDWHDTLEPATGWGGCDLNLLSGRGVVTGPRGEREIALPGPAPRLWDWRDAAVPDLLPPECFG